MARSKGSTPEKRLTHVNASGDAHMVGVSEKAVTRRRAVASARVTMRKQTLALIVHGTSAKGDVLAAARIAGIQAAKRAWELIPLCHQIALTGADIEFVVEGDVARSSVLVTATVDAVDRTGVEMEALVAASTAALTVYDMLKAVDRWMTITDLGLLEKSGGRSGTLKRGEP